MKIKVIEEMKILWSSFILSKQEFAIYSSLEFWIIHELGGEAFLNHNLTGLTTYLMSLGLSWKKVLLRMNSNKRMRQPTTRHKFTKKEKGPFYINECYLADYAEKKSFQKVTGQDILWHCNFFLCLKQWWSL